MADGPFGAREVFIDLTLAPAARVIRDAAPTGRNAEFAKIAAIRINGVAGAGDGDIILRSNSATGPVVFRLDAPNGSTHDGTLVFGHPAPTLRGLYMDSVGTAWAGAAETSFMVIYTA